MSVLNKFVQGMSDQSLVKSLEMEKRESGSPYTVAACQAVVFSNNMKHVHLHVKGRKFDNIHGLTQEYYDKASEDADYLAELCMEKEEFIPNFCNAAQFTPATVAGSPVYNYDSAIFTISACMGEYIPALENLRNAVPDTDIQSKLDDTIRYWKKELDFKTKQRLGKD